MGNGAGKNKNVVREIDPDTDVVDGNDDYYERLEEQARRGKAAAASKPVLGGLFGAKRDKAKAETKKAPKIVGLIDSDEDDDEKGDAARERARKRHGRSFHV